MSRPENLTDRITYPYEWKKFDPEYWFTAEVVPPVETAPKAVRMQLVAAYGPASDPSFFFQFEEEVSVLLGYSRVEFSAGRDVAPVFDPVQRTKDWRGSLYLFLLYEELGVIMPDGNQRLDFMVDVNDPILIKVKNDEGDHFPYSIGRVLGFVSDDEKEVYCSFQSRYSLVTEYAILATNGQANEHGLTLCAVLTPRMNFPDIVRGINRTVSNELRTAVLMDELAGKK